MSRTSKTLLRLGVPSLAAATMVAGIPAFLGTAAAAHVSSITLSPGNGSVPAGTCRVFTGTVTASTTTAVIDVLLDSPDAGVDPAFCSVTNGVATTTNNAVGGADRQEFTVNTATNNTGTFTFGVITAGNTTGTVNATAFAEAPNTLNNGNNIPNADEVPTTSSTTFTAGGAQAARSLVAAERQDPAVNGEVVSYDVTVRNATGQALPGVMPEFDVISGPDSTLVGPGTDCTVTNQSGAAVCSYTSAGGTGTNVVEFVVNQVNADSNASTADTLGPDAGEPTDTESTTIVAAQGNRSVVVTALADTATADTNFSDAAVTTAVNDTRDGDRVFRAVVDATNADTNTVGTRLAFTVTGGDGNETVVPRFGDTVNNTATADANDSAFEFTVNDPNPVSGQVLTVTATVRGTTQSGASTLTYKNRPADARNISVSPSGVQTTQGTLRTFTATVVDADGRPVEGVGVTFTETGAGAFRDGRSTTTEVLTNASGQATAEVTSLASETGEQTVTATISSPRTAGANNDNCELAAGAGLRPSGAAVGSTQSAGNCAASATHTFVTPAPATTAPATTAPAATNTATPTAPTTTRPATTAPATPTGTPTAPVRTQCVNPVGMTLNRAFIIPGIPVRVTVTAPAGAEVQLQAYSRPSTEYRVARQAVVGETGSITFDVVPGTNTRLFANCVAQTNSASTSQVINVRTALSLTVVRNGTRNYTFQGRILPRRAGQLITLYRIEDNGTRVLTSQIKTDATGTYRINRRFLGSGTFGFLTRTGQTLTNAAGESTSAQQQRSEEYLENGRGTARPTAIF